MMHAGNGHLPLRHTASYDETYSHHLQQQQNQLSPPTAGTLNGNIFGNSEYYAHCNEQKYRPPTHPDLCKFEQVLE